MVATANFSLPATRLLIVDDDVPTIRLMISILDELGDVYFATDAESALDSVRAHRPDLVLLNAEMPGQSGFELCRMIKGEAGLVDIPIIFLSAGPDIALETKGLEIGAADFVYKPPSPPIVRARVRTHLLLKQRTDEFQRQALIDGLTGVANRRAFDETLLTEWRRAKRSTTPLSLLIINVDYFKRFNDHYGHQAGDDCLRLIASTLVATSRRSGEFIARYAGEEFAIILPASDEATARSFAEKLCRSVLALQIPHAGSEASPYVTISIGVASQDFANASRRPIEPGSAANLKGAKLLLTLAGMALYAAKRGGRNQVSQP